MESCPLELEYLIEAEKIRRNRRDAEDWALGIYVQDAVSVAIEHNFAGKKAKSKYRDKPLLTDAYLSDEEKAEQTRQLLWTKLNLAKADFDREKHRKGVDKCRQ